MTKPRFDFHFLLIRTYNHSIISHPLETRPNCIEMQGYATLTFYGKNVLIVSLSDTMLQMIALLRTCDAEWGGITVMGKEHRVFL